MHICHLKKSLKKKSMILKKEIERRNEKIIKLERESKGSKVEMDNIGELLKELDDFDRRNRGSYNNARKEFNAKLPVFNDLYLKCLNVAEDFL